MNHHNNPKGQRADWNCKQLAQQLQSRPYVICKFPIHLHKILILYCNSVKSVKHKNDFIGFQRADVIWEQCTPFMHYIWKKQRYKSQRNTVSVLRVHKFKGMDMQGLKFESLSTIIYEHKKIHFNFSVFWMWAKHAAAEANIWCTKIALTKNILLSLLHCTSSKAVACACKSAHY